MALACERLAARNAISKKEAWPIGLRLYVGWTPPPFPCIFVSFGLRFLVGIEALVSSFQALFSLLSTLGLWLLLAHSSLDSHCWTLDIYLHHPHSHLTPPPLPPISSSPLTLCTHDHQKGLHSKESSSHPLPPSLPALGLSSELSI